MGLDGFYLVFSNVPILSCLFTILFISSIILVAIGCFCDFGKKNISYSQILYLINLILNRTVN